MIDASQPITARAEDCELARYYRPDPVSRG
jgi:hypothetical protein